MKNAKKTRRKMYHFSTLINDFNYYDCKKFRYNGWEGTIFYIEPFSNYRRQDTLEQYLANIEKAKTYDNVVFLKAKSQYAPEQIKQVIFVGR